MTAAPLLDGIHHLKLPVRDLDRSQAFSTVPLELPPDLHPPS